MSQTVDPGQQFDPKLQSEDLAFKQSDMIACNGCTRANPPNRLECLYCGKPLDVKPEIARDVKVNLRRLELFERGWNVIASRGPDMDPTVAGQIALLLGREPAEISEHLSLDLPLPVARVDSDVKADFLAAKLMEFGLDCRVVSDSGLNAENLPVRLKRIDFGDGELDMIAFNADNVEHIPADDVVLIVKGHLISSHTDVLERKRRRGNTTVLDETSTMNDEIVVDIYTRGDPIGHRVRMTGFDFSCLGERRALLAADNMNRLIAELTRFEPNATVVDDYVRVTHILDGVWEKESRRDPQGLQRVGLGKREFGTIASTNNVAQFTKYSRLQWHLL